VQTIIDDTVSQFHAIAQRMAGLSVSF